MYVRKNVCTHTLAHTNQQCKWRSLWRCIYGDFPGNLLNLLQQRTTATTTAAIKAKAIVQWIKWQNVM